jgi:hypothetical protein
MISIDLIDERGKVLQRFDDPLVARLLLDGAPDSSVCLCFIDPYGDTVFNALQLPVLLQEIRAATARSADIPARAQLRRFEQFVELAISRQPHVYLKFVGE